MKFVTLKLPAKPRGNQVNTSVQNIYKFSFVKLQNMTQFAFIFSILYFFEVIQCVCNIDQSVVLIRLNNIENTCFTDFFTSLFDVRAYHEVFEDLEIRNIWR